MYSGVMIWYRDVMALPSLGRTIYLYGDDRASRFWTGRERTDRGSWEQREGGEGTPPSRARGTNTRAERQGD